jgi:energy-coupling factor transporter ATP-binding protein EcfA2
MAKEFNVTGTCFPNEHYMVDNSEQLSAVRALIEKGKYFTINRPRQYGKTTTLKIMGKRLRETGEYLVFNLSFARVGDGMFADEFAFAPNFMSVLADNAPLYAPELKDWLEQIAPKTINMKMLDKAITDMINQTNKKVVLMIDEVDKSSNNQLFVSFLGMLRDKYLVRDEAKTFHSVVLAGVHDVKSLKIKLRPDEEQKFNSPWNIAVDFKVDMNFKPHEIEPMLKDYVAERSIVMNTKQMSERLFFYTSGYPYLVCKLCKIIDEDILPTKSEQSWTIDDLDQAVQMLMREPDNVNFTSLFINLEHNPSLYELVKKVIFDNVEIEFDATIPNIHLGVLYGLFAANEKNRLAIHNRIYRERIANYMVIKLQTEPQSDTKYNLNTFNFRGQFVRDDNSLDMAQVLLKFQAFMREHNSVKNRDFLEKDGRLLFMAFVKPIINGSGYDFKEPQISDEQRLDVVITFYQYRYLAELKIWHGEVAHQKGLVQLSDYLDKTGMTEGYLIIFNHNKKKTWKTEWIDLKGKKVFAVWV